MYQARHTDPTGTNPGGIWVNPIAAIPHCYPSLVRAAICLAESRIESRSEGKHKDFLTEQLGVIATRMAKFINIASSDTEVETYEQAEDKAELGPGLNDGLMLFNEALVDVFNQMYFRFIREALHPGERPIGVKELMAAVKERSNGTTSENT